MIWGKLELVRPVQQKIKLPSSNRKFTNFVKNLEMLLKIIYFLFKKCQNLDQQRLDKNDLVKFLVTTFHFFPDAIQIFFKTSLFHFAICQDHSTCMIAFLW